MSGTMGRMARPARFGRPVSVVLYRTPERWRWMQVDDKGGMLDGALPDTPATSDAAAAQAEFIRRLSQAEGEPWTAEWREGEQPDWWQADLRVASG
jgi:hypothetical protein